ncbi:MAG: class I SAM-dependent methyltransferase [Ruminococcaceae bacterium]|nr:class I SAM-dependent methyltransferase [Oscillospiraceae bacterium]
MEKNKLLFYEAYEAFYAMAKDSAAFRAYCRDAFGADSSQDGFSDLRQIDRILPYIPAGGDVHILDIGCGNGKMLGYLQEQSGAFIHGFDYSARAIETAKSLFPRRSDFREGVIGEIDYAERFDVITSMDTLYFAPDLPAFLRQVRNWMKPEGVFFVGYQEGDVIPKSPAGEKTKLAQALTALGMPYEETDITKECYELLTKKREAALRHREAFLREGQEDWYRLLLLQTDCAAAPYEQFREKMARYIYLIRK